jgi:peroxiredoxin Q/BCP
MRLEPGDKAPAFALLDDTGKTVKLSDFKGKSVLLYAYPAAMTPGCTKQACDFRDNLKAFAKHDLVVIAKFREHDDLTFTLLSDPDKSVLASYGAFGEKMMYGKTVTGVIRSTFVIDPKGKIEHAFYNVKATGHVAKLMRDLDI